MKVLIPYFLIPHLVGIQLLILCLVIQIGNFYGKLTRILGKIQAQLSIIGIDRYKSRSELVSYMYRAEKELYRVLKSDGCLWMRWCTMTSMDENNALSVFSNWTEMLKHEIGSSVRHTGKTKSFWFMLMKKPLQFVEPELFAVIPSVNPLKMTGDSNYQ